MKLAKFFIGSLCAASMMACGGPKESVVEAWWLPDREPSNNPVALFGDVPESIVEELGLQDGIPASMSAVLIKVDGMPILFDTGLGSPDSRLIASLAEQGVDASQLERIYITHLHGDHIGGLMNPASFPKAELWLSRVEYEAWKNMESGNDQQLKMFDMYKDRLHLFEFGDVLEGGVKSFDAKGHTPGHTVFEVGKYLIIGDLMHGAALQMAHPEYCPRYDQDPEQAVASRKKYVAYARENGLTMVGMHMPAPGFFE